MPATDFQTRALKVDLSMVSLKWGDFLSMLLPGTVVMFALKYWIPGLQDRAQHLGEVKLTEGVIFLIASALLGGILEGLTRVTWEKYWLIKRHPLPRVWNKLTPENFGLYENGVQGSYKYATFYANFGFAAIFLLVSLWHAGTTWCSLITFVLLFIIGLLFRASHVQWTYFAAYERDVFPEDKKMLKNAPPPGTEVRFVREVRKASRGSIGKLVRPLGNYLTENANDQFEVDYGGERITVRRDEIELTS